MLDHLVGRPSGNLRRLQTILLLLGGYQLSKFCHRYNFTNSFIVKWNEKLGKYSPLQLILFTLMSIHTLKNTFLLMGLEGPEPLARLYNRNFFRSSWVLIALDAGFWTAMPIRPKFLRDILSIWFSIFYLFFPEQAENKVRRFQATVTVEAMRVSWEKQLNPYFSLISMLSRPWFGVKKRILIPRPVRDAYDDEPIAAHIYFTGAAKDFASCKSIILSIPGGGFVSMPPACHESYFSLWCKDTNVPIISIDYKKAPEYPYPYALNECFDAYRTIVETKGRCLGLDGLKLSTISATSDNQKHHTEVPIALVGDSAGGNLATSIMYKILEWHRKPLARPQGLILIYPCLNFNISSWMSSGQIKMFRSQSVKTLEALWESKSHYKHKSPLSTFSDTQGRWRGSHYPSIEEQVHRQSYGERLNELARLRSLSENEAPKPTKLHRREPSREHIPARNMHSQLTMTSRMTFFNDRVLTPDLMRVMAILYIGPHNQPDFHNDYYLSPIVGPEHLLAQFPKTYLICGEKDPFVDDTILFAGRIRQAKMRAQRRNNSAAFNQNRNRGEGTSLFALTPLVDSKNNSQNNSKTRTFVIGDENSDVFSNESSDAESPPPSAAKKETSNSNNDFLVTGESLLLPVESYTRLYPANSSLNLNTPQSSSGGICEEQLGVEVRLLSGMSHAFLSMIPFLPEAVSSTKYIASWFLDILYINEDLPEDTD